MLEPITMQKPAMALSGALRKVMTRDNLEQAQNHDNIIVGDPCRNYIPLYTHSWFLISQVH